LTAYNTSFNEIETTDGCFYTSPEDFKKQAPTDENSSRQANGSSVIDKLKMHQ
jgi:hypothetical protein